MKFEGGCYCKAVRYAVDGDPMFTGLCHCRECQYISGGSANAFMVVAPAAFTYTRGQPKAFTRSDLPAPVTREFCPDCGTHLVARAPSGTMTILKVGTMDDPSLFGMPHMAIWTSEKQCFHAIPEGVAQFEKLPG
jgi:hypothetical protein